jgi:hypothetical protein
MNIDLSEKDWNMLIMIIENHSEECKSYDSLDEMEDTLNLMDKLLEAKAHDIIDANTTNIFRQSFQTIKTEDEIHSFPRAV